MRNCLYLKCSGVKHAGEGLRDLVKKLRNPFQFPNLVWKKALSRRRHMKDDPKLDLQIDHYLHPTLKTASKILEYAVLRLQFATEIMLQRYGANIIDQQMMLKRLADTAIDIYAMTCVLSRASRSYCIGLRNSQMEASII